MNSDLLDPGQTAPKVSPPAAHTPPMPRVKAETTKYYHLSVSTASMHRGDGKKLAFVHGVLATDDKNDQKYLDDEIAFGNTYLSEATPLQVESYKMTINPKQTIADQVRAEMEPELRKQLEEQIMAEIAAGVRATDGSKIAGVDTATQVNPKVQGAGFTASIVSSDSLKDATAGNGSSTQTTAEKLASLKKK